MVIWQWRMPYSLQPSNFPRSKNLPVKFLASSFFTVTPRSQRNLISYVFFFLSSTFMALDFWKMIENGFFETSDRIYFGEKNTMTNFWLNRVNTKLGNLALMLNGFYNWNLLQVLDEWLTHTFAPSYRLRRRINFWKEIQRLG